LQFIFVFLFHVVTTVVMILMMVVILVMILKMMVIGVVGDVDDETYRLFADS